MTALNTKIATVQTQQKKHKIILANLDRSPFIQQSRRWSLCPSIEDKVVRFKDKPTHQIFIEPEA